MKKMDELKVGEQTVVTVEHVDLGYATVDGIEYFVKGSDDLEMEVEYNSLDCFYVAKDDSKLFVLGEDSEFPVATVTRIR